MAVVAVAAKRKKIKSGTDWSWRLAGIALCAFFALGVITGLSHSGRIFAQRVTALLRAVPYFNRSALISVPSAAAPTAHLSSAMIALVERPDGFYELDDRGGLRGPVSPDAESDVAILSGPAAAESVGAQLVDYARTLIAAEATLGVPVSEMRVGANGDATLYLERPAIAIVIEIPAPMAELGRAAKILGLWRGHSELIAAMDLTVPGQVIVRMRDGTSNSAGGGELNAGRLTRARLTRPAHRTEPEVTTRQ